MCVHQWFWHCAWKVNNTRLTKRLHFLQKCGLFPRMLYFLFSILEKKKCLYTTMILMPAMNSALYCCTYYYLIYVYIYTLFDKFIGFFHNSLCFSKNVFDIQQTWVQFPAANSEFPEKCSASFHAAHECFSIKNMSKLNMHFFKR